MKREDVLALHELFTAFIRKHYCGHCEVCRKLARISRGMGFEYDQKEEEAPEATGHVN